ncbi:MAG: hypothetical protein AAFW69_03520, partial [Pseudomonadota bacterium]
MAEEAPKPPPQVVALWIGPRLDWVGRLCLTSHLVAGHPVALYSYDRVEGVPEGVERRDAADILPLDEAFLAAAGPRIFSDLWRIEMLLQKRGIWIDCDALALHPLPPRARIAGWLTRAIVGTGVLRLPPHSDALHAMRRFIEEPRSPDALGYMSHHLDEMPPQSAREDLLALAALRQTVLGPSGASCRSARADR